MGYVYNPLLGAGLDQTGAGGGGGTPGGADTQIQFNDAGAFGGDADLTWNKTTNVMTVAGDVNLNDGGTYTTTLQTVTPTANRVISLPNATGTVALVAGSSGQLTWNNAGAYAGVTGSTADTSGNVTLGGRFISSLNGAVSSTGITGVPIAATGTWFTGGTGTTTKPQVLIEPTGTTSTGWSVNGTGIGVNAASGFTGNLLDLQVNGSNRYALRADGISFFRGDQYWTNSAASVNYARIDSTGLTLTSATGISWGNTTNVTGIDLFILRDAAGTLAQRNGTNAQTFRVYNTYTSGTNYELGKLEWSSNVFRIGTEKGSGGGTARTVEVHTDSVSRLALDTTGSVRVVTGLTVATLPGTPTVGMIARVTDATAPAVGSTVAGGGAANALCWYNGTNWTVLGV